MHSVSATEKRPQGFVARNGGAGMIRYMVAGAVLLGLFALVAAEIFVCVRDWQRTKRWEKEVDERIGRYRDVE